MKTKLCYTINTKPELSDTTKEISEAVGFINTFINSEIAQNIDGITIKSAFASKNCQVIFHLKRDQRVRFKKIADDMIQANKLFNSVYVEFKDQFIHVGGFEYLFEKINGYSIYISPNVPLQDNSDEKFYREILFFAPKGRTRNAIVLGVHCGIIPIHIANLYNRIYAIDKNEKQVAEAKQNLIQNSINNCLLYCKNIQEWTKEFVDGAYNPPGKVQRIGLMVVDLDVIDQKVFELFDCIKAETVIMFSKNLSKFQEYSKILQAINYKTRETKAISVYFLDKFKRLDNDNKNE